MPIIPLVQPQQMPDAPAAVLNHEKLPTVDNSGVMAGLGKLATASQGQTMDGKALAAPYAGLGAIGDAIAKTGTVLGGLASKVQEARTDKQVADADAEMQMELAKHEAWRSDTNADPAAWGDDLEKRLSGLKVRLGDREDLTPGARQQIDLRMTRFTGQAAASTMSAAARETFQQAKSSFAATIDRATESQDPTRFEDAVKTGEGKGYFFPHEVENFRQTFTKEGERQKKQAEADSFDTALNDVTSYASGKGEQDALKALDDGVFGKFASADSERLRSTIKQVSNSRSAEAMGILADGISKGEVSSPARIDELAHNNPHLSPKVVAEAKRYLGARDQQQLDAEKEQNGTLNAVHYYSLANEYDRAADKDGSAYFQLKVEVGDHVPAKAANEILNLLDAKFTGQPGKLPVGPEVEHNVRQAIRDFYDPVDGALPYKSKDFTTVKRLKDDSPLFGKPQYKAGDVVTDPKTGKPQIVTDKNGNQAFTWKIDLAKKERSELEQTKLMEKMNSWFRANPEKANDPDAANKELHRLLPEGTRLGVLDTLQRKRLPDVPPLAKDSAANVGNALFDVNGSLILPTK